MNIDDIDENQYDVEAIEFDRSNGNYNDLSSYLHVNIVKASILNGQQKQAQEQCQRFGLELDVVKLLINNTGE